MYLLYKEIALVITGSIIPVIIMFFNNKYQNKREQSKYENERKSEYEKRYFETEKNYHNTTIKAIEEINQLLFFFENSISLTNSVINSSRKISLNEFDMIYNKELEKLTQLKGIIIARFPDYYENTINIKNLHNRYWGYQRILLSIDYQNDKKGHSNILEKIINIADETKIEIDNFISKLKKYSEEINNKYSI